MTMATEINKDNAYDDDADGDEGYEDDYYYYSTYDKADDDLDYSY